MNEEQLLRERLHNVPVPPLELGMDTVVAGGFRKLRRRRAATMTAAAVLSAAVLAAVPALLPASSRDDRPQLPAAQNTPASLSCAPADDLRVPDNVRDMEITALDPTGRYAVGNGTMDQDFVPYFFRNGTAVRVPFTGRSAEMIDVNAAGIAIGRGSDGKGGPETLFRYAAGKLTTLTMPAGEWMTLGRPKLNATGEVVATVQPAGSSEGRGAIVLRWPGNSAIPDKLSLGQQADASDHADDGTIAGTVRTEPSVASLWNREGTRRTLETPAGFAGVAYAISSDGAWVTGGLWDRRKGADGNPVLALWNTATGKLVTRLDIDDVGKSVTPGGLILTLNGALYRDGKPIEVPGATTVTALSDSNRTARPGGRTWQC